MKRQLLMICLALMLILGIGRYFMLKTKNANSQPLQPLTIGVMPDFDSIPFIVALHNGYFEREGICVKIEYFQSAMERDAALQTGNIDGAVSDMLAVIFLKDSGFDVKITSKTKGSFQLVTGKDARISNLEELKGKTIGISQNTIIEYITDKILEKAHIDAHTVEKIIIPKIPTRLEMLAKGNIDMAVLPEPLASLAVGAGGKILGSSDLLGLNPGVVLFTQEAVHTKSKEIRALYRAYNQAVAYLNKEKPENYMDILTKEASFPESVKDTWILPNFSNASMPSEKELREVLNWLQSKNLTNSSYSLEELWDKSFIE